MPVFVGEDAYILITILSVGSNGVSGTAIENKYAYAELVFIK
jgi:hypothetical protein